MKPSLSITIGKLKPSKDTSKKHGLSLGEESESEPMEDGDDVGLQAGADELLAAIASKDSAAVAEAFKVMFQLCESQPHSEYDE